MHRTDLLTLADLYARHQRRALATVSNRIVGHARLFSRLKANQGTTIRTYERALAWFDQNWPADLEWPAGVSRPSRKRAA